MIEEDYVNFEIAKLLKEKGFDVYGDGSFGSETKVWMEYSPTGKINDVSTSRPHPKAYPAPTLQMAMKWLREVHSCYIVTYWEFKNYDENGNPVFKDIIWSYNIAIPKYNSARKGDGDYFDIESEKEDYTTYEEVCEAAITYCLENLI